MSRWLSPDLETLRLGKHETFTTLPISEIHNTTESKAEFTIATAIRVLKPMPFLLNPKNSDFIYCNNHWNPRRGSMGHVQSEVRILDGVDKTI